MCLFEPCRATQLYTPTDCISHLLLIWDLMAFPNDVVPVHNVLFKCLLGPFVKCWDLSLLLSLTQTLCPNQCSHVWRGSLSPAIILQVIPSRLSRTRQMGQVRVSHSMNIDADPEANDGILYVHVYVCECGHRGGRRGSAGRLGCICNNTNQAFSLPTHQICVDLASHT